MTSTPVCRSFLIFVRDQGTVPGQEQSVRLKSNPCKGNLFLSENKNCERKLMDMIDNINFSQRDDVLKFAASGTTMNWKMQQNFISKRYTTRWEELFEVR